MALSSTRIIKVIVVTDDMEKTADAYRRLLGTDRKPDTGSGEHHMIRKPFTRYKGQPIGATPMKNVSILSENFWFEIIQPLNEEGPWADWLKEHGTSICAVSLLTSGPLEDDDALMESSGFPLLFKQEKGYEAYDYFDTARSLGVLLEMKEQY